MIYMYLKHQISKFLQLSNVDGALVFDVSPGFFFWWQIVFCALDIGQETGGRSTGQPGGSLSSVDRSPGSPRRCLCIIQVLTPPYHGALGPVDHLELFVLSWGQLVYCTGTLAWVAVQRVRLLIPAIGFVMKSLVPVLTH